MDTAVRRETLKSFAKACMKMDNKALALVTIVDKAARLVEGSVDPADDMIDDLKKVIIGDGYTSGRGIGKYFVGNFKGAKGFKASLQDPYNQVQHAMAGVAVGHEAMWLGQVVVTWHEEQPQDRLLYDLTCPLGRELNDDNYRDLARRVCNAICADDTSCNSVLSPKYHYGPGGVFPLSV